MLRIKTYELDILDENNELPFLTLLASSFEHTRRVGNSSEAYSRIYLQMEYKWWSTMKTKQFNTI